MNDDGRHSSPKRRKNHLILGDFLIRPSFGTGRLPSPGFSAGGISLPEFDGVLVFFVFLVKVARFDFDVLNARQGDTHLFGDERYVTCVGCPLFSLVNVNIPDARRSPLGIITKEIAISL